MNKKEKEFAQRWYQITAKASLDPAFKARLLKDPENVLKEYGINFVEKKKIHVYEDTPHTMNLVLRSDNFKSISEEELREIAAGHPGSGIWMSF